MSPQSSSRDPQSESSAPKPDSSASGQGNPVEWLEEHGDALFGFALRRVQRHDVAEDLVQETLLAGFQGFASFDARANERTWLTGILKNKIVDHFRREAARETKERQQHPTDRNFGQAGLFKKNGQWLKRLANWSTQPADNLERSEFWLVFEDCLSKLPTSLKAVFILKEMDGEETEQACEQLGITPSNASVRLYRARLNLRACLERNWFNAKR
jgi:RNA polymerase sigma-70 factor (ECF subfamily)